MSSDAQLDAGHISFLDMIRTLISQSGVPNTKGTLIRTALATAEEFTPESYSRFEEFVESLQEGVSAIARFEGRAEHLGEGVFGLRGCPFAASIKSYRQLCASLPSAYAQVTEEFNKPSGITSRYRVGHGAGVSPFCAVHQPLRSAAGEKVTVDARQARVFQLGCKSGTGAKGLAYEWISELGMSAEEVGKLLDNYACCYAVRTDDE